MISLYASEIWTSGYKNTKFTIDVLVVHVSSIADTISSENIATPSPNVDIDSQSDLNIPIAHRKKKGISHYIHCIAFCLVCIILLFSLLILILFSGLFQ